MFETALAPFSRTKPSNWVRRKFFPGPIEGLASQISMLLLVVPRAAAAWIIDRPYSSRIPRTTDLPFCGMGVLLRRRRCWVPLITYPYLRWRDKTAQGNNPPKQFSRQFGGRIILFDG